MSPPTTFDVSARVDLVTEMLAELGFVVEAPQSTAITVLDTFDGLVHRSGLRLALVETDGAQLELSGRDMPLARRAVDAQPRLPADLPPGPLRNRLAEIVGVRALLPHLRVRARRTNASLRDAAGKIVVTAELLSNLDLPDHPGVDCPDATLTIEGVAGYAKKATRPLDSLRASGASECASDTLTLCATAAGIDLAGSRPVGPVALDPATTAIDGFRKVLRALAATVGANWQGTIDRTDTEFLHDLRIAIRRTRTVLGAAQRVLPDDVRDPARADFAWLAQLTSVPRDLDVYLLEWSTYIGALGNDARGRLEPVRDVLERRSVDAHITLEHGMRSARAEQLMRSWIAWLDGPLADELPDRARRPLGEHIARRIARSHDALIEHGRMIDADTPAEHLHDLRKDAKKLRYLLEDFSGLLPARPLKQYVKQLKSLQDNLGGHQDAEVHIHMLREVASELHDTGASADTMMAIGQLIERLDGQRLRERREFAARFADHDSSSTRRALRAMLDGIDP
jgi:CHAD domain-containing protein